MHIPGTFDSYRRVWIEVSGLEHGHGGPGWEVGRRLFCPTTNELGFDRYALIREVAADDLILHWIKDEHGANRALVGWSLALGPAVQTNEIPPNPGGWAGATVYRVDLRDFTSLDRPLPIRDFEARHGPAILAQAQHRQNNPYERNRIRIVTGLYLRECGPELYDLLMHDVALLGGPSVANRPPILAPAPQSLGSDYRPPDEEIEITPPAPSERDPDKIDRSTRAHRRTQNQLARFLRSAAIEPRSPAPGEPKYDLAWRQEQTFVAEVKSLPLGGDEHQLRIGLGQVLRYRQMLGGNARAVLVVEREPLPAGWLELCAEVGVLLVWPDTFHRLLA